MQELEALFYQHFGEVADRVLALKPQASARRIFRLQGGGHTAIGVVNQDAVENRVFLRFTDFFLRAGLPVPRTYCIDSTDTAYLEEDLGDNTLYDVLCAQRRESDPLPAGVEALYAQAVQVLPHFQVQAVRGFDFAACHPRRSYDASGMEADLEYFETAFLQRLGCPY
ncbi:MAG: RapZ C-terminal domain-containing protein, partial [Candidatus Xenobia bacterium]